MIAPLSFDASTAREITGDAQARLVEEKARSDADADKFDPPSSHGQTYWDQVRSEMLCVVYREQFTKRRARNLRKANA